MSRQTRVFQTCLGLGLQPSASDTVPGLPVQCLPAGVVAMACRRRHNPRARGRPVRAQGKTGHGVAAACLSCNDQVVNTLESGFPRLQHGRTGCTQSWTPQTILELLDLTPLTAAIGSGQSSTHRLCLLAGPKSSSSWPLLAESEWFSSPKF